MSATTKSTPCNVCLFLNDCMPCLPMTRITELSCLRHLRELKADGNAITSLDGLDKLDSLTRLSLRGNSITEVDFGELRWCAIPSFRGAGLLRPPCSRPRLELLNLSRNRLRRISGLSALSSLAALNLGTWIELPGRIFV